MASLTKSISEKGRMPETIAISNVIFVCCEAIFFVNV